MISGANMSAQERVPLPGWPPSHANVTKIKAAFEHSSSMNYVADQPIMVPFLQGIYTDSSDISYLKLKC